MELSRMMPLSLRPDFAVREQEGLEEIRFRVGQPTELLYGDGRKELLAAVSEAEIGELLNYLSGYSLYSLEEQLRQGYFTIEGGCRIGVSGRTGNLGYFGGRDRPGALGEAGGKIPIGHGVLEVGSVNIRVAHEKKGCAQKIVPLLWDGSFLHNTLIFSPPGVGKTTYLRDCIRLLSTGGSGHSGIKIGVVDERSEIAACYRGIPQNDLGPRADVLDGCPKAQGMQMLLRSMSPQVIAVDELGRRDDFAAVFQMLHAGVRLLGTIHAQSLEELAVKPYMRDLMREKKIGRYVELFRENTGKRNFTIFNETGKKIWEKSLDA